jgi:hypothetical protein
MKIRRPKDDRPEKPRLRDRLRRSRYSGHPEPEPPQILVNGGQIVGYQLSDGTVVKAEPCCANHAACHKPECWSPRARPWWMGP